MTLKEEIEQIIINSKEYGESIETLDKTTEKILKIIEKRIGEIWKQSLLDDLRDGDAGLLTEEQEHIRADFRRRLWDRIDEELLK